MNELVNKILRSTGLESALTDEIINIGRVKKVKEGNPVMSPESPGNEMPIVLEGLLKVSRQDTEGHEVFLYFLEGGETCAMSIACCIKDK
jgi:CRP/FNR family transcriptional regulator